MGEFCDCFSVDDVACVFSGCVGKFGSLCDRGIVVLNKL